MRRRVLAGMMVAMLFLLGLSLAQAEPVQQASQVQITVPEMNAEVRGLVAIIGSASVPNFQFYKIEFGVGPNPAQWAVVGSLHDKTVLNGQMEVWDTARLPDGVHTLRLQAVKRDGNYEEFVVRGLTVANARPEATKTTTATPLMLSTAFVAPTLVITTPRATATIKIMVPTAALSAPSATPTLNRPAARETFSLDVKGWGQSLVFGAAAVGVVFVLLGIVFGLRRLL